MKNAVFKEVKLLMVRYRTVQWLLNEMSKRYGELGVEDISLFTENFDIAMDNCFHYTLIGLKLSEVEKNKIRDEIKSFSILSQKQPLELWICSAIKDVFQSVIRVCQAALKNDDIASFKVLVEKNGTDDSVLELAAYSMLEVDAVVHYFIDHNTMIALPQEQDFMEERTSLIDQDDYNDFLHYYPRSFILMYLDNSDGSLRHGDVVSFGYSDQKSVVMSPMDSRFSMAVDEIVYSFSREFISVNLKR